MDLELEFDFENTSVPSLCHLDWLEVASQNAVEVIGGEGQVPVLLVLSDIHAHLCSVSFPGGDVYSSRYSRYL